MYPNLFLLYSVSSVRENFNRNLKFAMFCYSGLARGSWSLRRYGTLRWSTSVFARRTGNISRGGRNDWWFDARTTITSDGSDLRKWRPMCLGVRLGVSTLYECSSRQWFITNFSHARSAFFLRTHSNDVSRNQCRQIVYLTIESAVFWGFLFLFK